MLGRPYAPRLVWQMYAECRCMLTAKHTSCTSYLLFRLHSWLVVMVNVAWLRQWVILNLCNLNPDLYIEAQTPAVLPCGPGMVLKYWPNMGLIL